MVLFPARLVKAVTPERVLAPAGFEAVADALEGNGDLLAATQDLGRRTALEGAALDDVLDDLAATYRCRGGWWDEPPLRSSKRWRRRGLTPHCATSMASPARTRSPVWHLWPTCVPVSARSIARQRVTVWPGHLTSHSWWSSSTSQTALRLSWTGSCAWSTSAN
ncbi:MAG: hypothetical protein WKF73_22005 [Nocardioidaceae bacterium]